MTAGASLLRRRLSAEDRREQILEAAARLFTERGFETVTVADLAYELQTSRPTIYTYYASTEAILEALLEQRLAALLARLDPLLRELRPPAPGEPPSEIARVVLEVLLTEGDTLKLLHSGGAPTFQRRRNAFLKELGERVSFSPQSLIRREPLMLVILTSLLDALALRMVTESDLDLERLSRVLNVFVTGGTTAVAAASSAAPEPKQ